MRLLRRCFLGLVLAATALAGVSAAEAGTVNAAAVRTLAPNAPGAIASTVSPIPSPVTPGPVAAIVPIASIPGAAAGSG